MWYSQHCATRLQTSNDSSLTQHDIHGVHGDGIFGLTFVIPTKKPFIFFTAPFFMIPYEKPWFLGGVEYWGD